MTSILSIFAESIIVSRVNFIGAYYSALKGVGSIPNSWVKKTEAAKKILRQN